MANTYELEKEIEELQAKIKLKAGQKAMIHKKQREAQEKAKKDGVKKYQMEVQKESDRLQYYRDLMGSRGAKLSAFGNVHGRVFGGDGSSIYSVNQLLGIVDCLKEDIDKLEKRIKKLEGKK